MKVFEVELDDGRRYHLQVDDGASDAEIEAEIELLKARTAPSTDPTQSMSGPDLFLAGIGRGMVNTARQVGNMVGLVEDETLEQAREIDRPLMETGAGQAGSFVGELAATAPLAGGAVGLGGKALAAARPALRGATAARPIATGAATGAAEGALEGAILAGPGNRLQGAALGAGLGAPGGALLPLITRGFRTPGEGVETLAEMGITDITPGQMVPTGAWNAIEETMTSAPLIGPFIEQARQRGPTQFAQEMIQMGRPPGAERVAMRSPAQMLDDVYKKFKPAYDEYKGIPLPEDTASVVSDDFIDAAMDQTRLYDRAARNNALEYLDNLRTKIEDRTVQSGDLLEMRSDLRGEIFRLKKSGKLEEADLLENAERALTERINTVLPEDAAQGLKAVDTQYAKYKISEDALYRAGDKPQPTNFQWQQAVKNAMSSKGAYARGGGLMREQAQAAAETFQQVAPKTGARNVTLGLLGAATGGYLGMNDPLAAAYLGLPMAALAGSRTGRRFATGQTPFQATAQQVIPEMSLRGAMLRGALPIYTEGE